jgi:hypothetical protein
MHDHLPLLWHGDNVEMGELRLIQPRFIYQEEKQTPGSFLIYSYSGKQQTRFTFYL